MTVLEGMRILDMTQYEAGTSCTQALAWMGADVVKIEAPNRGDPGRGIDGNAEYFVVWNSNKRSVAIDLQSAKGRQLLLDMLPNFDVFVENYGPGVIEKLDLGYEVMREVKPDIIYARLKGFGLSGPWADYKCYDMVAQAAAGAFSITGYSDGPPMRPGPTMGDAGTGVQLALAITAAYVKKLTSGEGQFIEISMQEAMTYYLRTSTSGGQYGENAASRNGNGHGPTMNLYPCKGGGPNDYLYIMAVTPRMWQDLCHAIERPDILSSPEFSDRQASREKVIDVISQWTRQHNKYEGMRLLAEAGVPASAVLTTQDLYSNPHLVERGFVHELDHPEKGSIRLLGWAPRMSGNNVPIKAAPRLGEHTQEVVTNELGLEHRVFSELVEEGVLGV